MKPLAKAGATTTAIVVGALVFGLVYLIGYLNLLSHQPPHVPGKPWPKDVTSFPPTAAWVLALPCGMGAFVVTFFVKLILSSPRHHKTDKA